MESVNLCAFILILKMHKIMHCAMFLENTTKWFKSQNAESFVLSPYKTHFLQNIQYLRLWWFEVKTKGFLIEFTAILDLLLLNTTDRLCEGSHFSVLKYFNLHIICVLILI